MTVVDDLKAAPMKNAEFLALAENLEAAKRILDRGLPLCCPTQFLQDAATFIRTAATQEAESARLREALRFYADPFAWKRFHDPGNDVRVPDFYNETSFGDTALVALATPETK